MTHIAPNVLSRWLLNRAPADLPRAGSAAGKRLTTMLNDANRWRELYSPLRGLTVDRVVALRESYLRGEMADVQWVYDQIESSDPTLFALATRRHAAIAALDWHVNECDDQRSGYDATLAQEQSAALREAYERIDNLQGAIAHLCSATFRGYALMEPHPDAAGVTAHLELCDSWNVVRDGRKDRWRLNPTADARSYASLGADMDIPLDRWIVRTVPRHLDWIALLLYVRASLCEKDWDAFVEIYGVPGATVIGPPNVPADKETEYETAGTAVAEGGSGYLPNGATIVYPDSVRGTAPFKERLNHLSEQLVLAGTGGKLTMLAAPTGLGQGASGEQADVFADIARAEGRDISAVFQRQFDAAILNAAFPGRPVLAYWELGAEVSDPTETIDHAVKLKSAGYRIGTDELSEKTGYDLEEAEEPAAPQIGAIPGDPAQADEPSADGDTPTGENPAEEPIMNRAGSAEPVSAFSLQPSAFFSALAADLRPVAKRLEAILQIEDPEIFTARLTALREELADLLADVNRDPASAQVLSSLIADAFAAGRRAVPTVPAQPTSQPQ